VDHRPVMLQECLDALLPASGKTYVDVTGGLGGHSERLLELTRPAGRLVVMDRDPFSLSACRERLAPFGDRVRFVDGNFDRFDERAGLEPGSVHGVLADLGVSSPQLDRAERGFSLLRAGPLDMRMDPREGRTALELLQGASEDTLREWLRRAGEERFSRKLARRLKESAATFATTEDLAQAVCRWIPRRGHSHPATRVFLALRMAVNQEMESLDGFLNRVPAVLAPGGRLAVLSFHSEEDRRVKWFGRQAVADGRLTLVHKKPLDPTPEEQHDNPRSRSAKLRVFEKPDEQNGSR